MAENMKEDESFKSAAEVKLQLPWKTRIMVSIGSFITDATRRSDGTINRRLINLVDSTAPSKPTPSRGLNSSDVVLDPSRRLWVRLYLPTTPSSKPYPIIVFFHGGGFAFLSAASRNYDAACRRFARKIPTAVVSVNYRLSPEHRYPAQYDDGMDVLRALDSGDERLESLFQIADVKNCFLAGDSAGANIAHHVARRWSSEEAGKGEHKLRLAGMVAIQPFFGGEGRVESELRLPNVPLVNTERTDWLWKAFLPEGDNRDHQAANVFGPRSGVTGKLAEGFPSTMVVIGGFDPLQDWQRKYVAGLKEREKEVKVVEYPATIHAFYLFPELLEAALLVGEVKEFVGKHCSG